MKYKVNKMDRRYTRHGYQYLIEFSKVTHFGTGVLDFDRARRWFTQTYGWSQDVEQQMAMQLNKRHHQDAYQPNDINPHWASLIKYDDYRIYVATEKELAFFILSHPQT